MRYIRDTEIKPIGSTKTNRQHAIFLCPKCDKEVEKPKKDGKKANTCGCKTNYLNKTIGNFFIIDDDLEGRSRRLFLVKCLICEKEKEILAQSIVNNKITSCGCDATRISAEKHIKHGDSYKRLYKIFLGIKGRCNNQNNEAYTYYGGRGIKICKEWEDSYDNFKKWSLGNGYDDNLTIDRIKVDGDYEPSNCRWTNSFVQARNTRILQKNNTSGYKGVSKTECGNFVAKLTVNYDVIRLGTFKTAIEGAKARDKYIIDNNLEHARNFNAIGIYIQKVFLFMD